MVQKGFKQASQMKHKPSEVFLKNPPWKLWHDSVTRGQANDPFSGCLLNPRLNTWIQPNLFFYHDLPNVYYCSLLLTDTKVIQKNPPHSFLSPTKRLQGKRFWISISNVKLLLTIHTLKAKESIQISYDY